ncbi:MAG: universal stress protein [Bacteroidales bacterium]
MSNQMITLANLSFPRAELLKAQLANEGVSAYLTNLNQIQGSPPASKVQVQEEDLPVAMRILRIIEQEYGPEEIEEEEKKRKDRILIPVDFSNAAEKSIAFSLSLANKINADIKLLHTYFNPALGMAPFNESITYQDAMASYIRDLHIKAKTKLIKLTNDIQKQIQANNIKGVTVDYFLTMGDSAVEILRISKQFNPNVIVMPIRLSEEKENNLISAITANVIDNAKHPVLAIPEHFDKQDIWEIKNILYIATYDQHELKAIKNLMRLVVPVTGAKIHVLQIYEGEKPKAAEYQMQVIEEFFNRYNKIEFTSTDLHCKSKESVEKINHYIEDNNIHTLSLVNYKQNLIGRLLYPSIARKMVFHSKTPLLVFPDKKTR